jgi:hypothetical protein
MFWMYWKLAFRVEPKIGILRPDAHLYLGWLEK